MERNEACEMKLRYLLVLALLIIAGTLTTTSQAAHASNNCPVNAGITTCTGTFSDGANYLIQVPANWNGTLALYSHGYTFTIDLGQLLGPQHIVQPSPLDAADVGDPATGAA